MTQSRTLAASLAILVGCHDAPNAPVARDATHATPVDRAIALGVAPLAIDGRGIPHIVRVAPGSQQPMPGTATQVATAQVRRLANVWGVDQARMPELEAAGEMRVQGGTIARLQQVIDGVPIEKGELRVLVRATGELVAVSGALVGLDAPRSANRFAEDDAGAIARAIAHTHAVPFDRAALHTHELRADGSRLVAGATPTIAVQLASAKRVWRAVDGALIAAWRVEAYSSAATTTMQRAFRTILAADDGRVLAHIDLVHDAAFGYRVYADPTGDHRPNDTPLADFSPHPTSVPDVSFPAAGTSSLVTIDGLDHPAGQAGPDPWLPAASTATIGNNVEAYVDLAEPDGLSPGDFHATTTTTNTFDYSFDLALDPLANQTQQKAAVASLFYVINWQHDFWYDAGFTEAAGNAQKSNYGRGGIENDPLLAEAQDGALEGIRNNAFMATPEDGMSPKMEVYLFTGGDDRSITGTGRTPLTNVADFGPQDFDVTGSVVVVGEAACSPITTPVTGTIVLTRLGFCSPEDMASNVQAAGGIAMLAEDYEPSPSVPRMYRGFSPGDPVTIGSMAVTATEGAALRADLLAGPVTLTMHRAHRVDVEGALDATVIAHEFGHYLHLRLTSCEKQACGGMSEGWGDFNALLMIAREGDDLTKAYPMGGYVSQSFTSDPGYFGIRRAPYSVNMAINGLVFRHVGQSALPAQPIINQGPNSEVHNAGEVWASILWEGYVALQQAGTSFETVRRTMAGYVVAGLAMTPPDATHTEARDAILLAAAANSPADADVLAAAFARRGLGSCATASTSVAGVTESYTLAGHVVVGSIAFEDSIVSCDSDGTLDSGETARIIVPIVNNGYLPLTNIVATLTSTTPGTTISGPITIPTLAPSASTTATFEFALAPGSSLTQGGYGITFTDDGTCPDLAIPATFRLNQDDVPASSVIDHFDTLASVWAPLDPETGWQHERRTVLEGFWHGTGVTIDDSLVSPPLVAGASPVVITLSHRYDFAEGFDVGEGIDAGVIEYTTDDGATWADIATLASPGYTGTVTTFFGEAPPAGDGPPLAGRPAFIEANAAYPMFEPLTLDLGTQLSGKTFQLRFRIGTVFGFFPGWEIDDVEITGVGTPFPTLVTDPGCEDEEEPEVPDGGGCCDAGPLRATNGALALGVLAFVGRRRRSRAR